MIDINSVKKRFTPEAQEVIERNIKNMVKELQGLGSVEVMRDGEPWPFNADTAFRDHLRHMMSHYVSQS